MSINIGKETSKLTIYKDEQGRYKTYIKSTKINQDNEEEHTFMAKKVQFKKGVEVKNKSVIEVTDGWLTPYKIKTDELNEDGKPKYKYFDKLFINSFNLLEEGTDEVQKTRQPKQEPQDSFAFDNTMDELPF